ncbi:hypothetical protein C3941_06345 [Kaistia algarum]|uniref:HlyU family transcriptional regulator n=1 Tax=Kaistia algarum TaxID=2083279 RepID=UPI000CE79668|nr:HlyU family transcriptional regulator [Kaistia algarum]MCX5515707.1 HlyU family transcriptional regulator [Kaistia algarum]PPE80913.1 hypothetical protein C3941_06345 [Kaistia algarum]
MAGFLSKLFGSKGGSAETIDEATEYRGHRIRPAPMAVGGQFQVAGFIEKDVNGVTKSYRFIRVDKHASRDDAVTLIVMKGQQIIDEQGDRIYDQTP